MGERKREGKSGRRVTENRMGEGRIERENQLGLGFFGRRIGSQKMSGAALSFLRKRGGGGGGGVFAANERF